MDNFARWNSNPKRYLDGVITGVGEDTTGCYGECIGIEEVFNLSNRAKLSIMIDVLYSFIPVLSKILMRLRAFS